MVLAAYLAGAAIEVIKLFVERARPEEVLGSQVLLAEGRSWGHLASYPSGHLIVTAAMASAAAAALPVLRGPLLAYVVMIGLTRVLFGAHFPIDVLVGAVMGYELGALRRPPDGERAAPSGAARNAARASAGAGRDGLAMTKLGVFVVPDAGDPELTVGRIVAADRAGLDLVGVQDHPYQRRFFDTWTLLAYVAARTERITLLPDVINLPLRQPAVLAKAAASLDVLSGGRVELGLGAGAFWEGVEAMGGPRRTAGESVEALEEAMQIMRAFLDTEQSVRLEGTHYRAAGAKPGPAPRTGSASGSAPTARGCCG